MDTTTVATEHAYYSAEHASACGTVIYRDLGGEEVEVTLVADPCWVRDNYGFADKVHMGVIREFVRVGRPPNNQFFVGF